MRNRKVWTCDFKGCNDFAQWCRKRNGNLLTLCTKHEADLARRHWGRRIDASELNEDDIRYLEGKERRKELAKKKPFEVRLYKLEDGWKIRIKDKQTDERRSFVIKHADLRRFDETFSDLEREGFSPKPSIDDYVKRLRNSVSSSI